MKVLKATVVKALDAVQPGLSKKEEAEQSDCFGFEDGEVITYNGGISVRIKSGLPDDLLGAIKAKELSEHFRRIKADKDGMVDITDEGDIFLLKGLGERVKFVKEKKFKLPVRDVERPEKWNKLPDDFIEGIEKVQECAGTNEAEFTTVCVHIAPNWVEAFDNFQMCRFSLETGFENDTIVKREYIKHILGSKVTEFAETERWIHFRNEKGLEISCLKAIGEYLDITEFLEGEAEWSKLTIPEGLGDKVASASISSASSEFNQVKVVLDGEKHRVYVIGLGAASEYKGWKDIDYSGKQLSFMVSPRLLSDITKQYDKCQITDGRLKVSGENFTYCTCLSRVVEKDLDDTEKKPKKKKVKKGELSGSAV
ncbi:hypothetical protein C4577_04205 [Candidatus Parcubacteria bacterium]|nr:MAG: hypothetical protein C4577_04205 [Candidatus Parcubacteria bacterium]